MFQIPTAKQLIGNLLLTQEHLICEAYQIRPMALAQRRQGLFATDKRLILISPRFISGFLMTEVQWQDLHQVHLKEDLLSSSVQLIFYSRDSTYFMTQPDIRINLSGFRKDTLVVIYRICQQQVQIWRHRNRIRHIEENISKTGYIYR